MKTQWGYDVDDTWYVNPYMLNGVEFTPSEQAALEVIRNYCGWHITAAPVSYEFSVCPGQCEVTLPFMMITGFYAGADIYVNDKDFNKVHVNIDGYILTKHTDGSSCCSECLAPGTYKSNNWTSGLKFEQSAGLIAIIKQVAQALEQPANVVSEKAGSVMITYDNGKRSGILGERIKALLSPYKIGSSAGW